MAFIRLPVVFIYEDNDDDGDLSAILRKSEDSGDDVEWAYRAINTNCICDYYETIEGDVVITMTSGDRMKVLLPVEEFEKILMAVDYIADVNKYITEN